MSSKRLVAFGWYGGKHYHLDWLLPLLPREGVDHFVDVFGGGASVILNVKPYPVETYNDLNGDVVHFFRMLRERPDELMEQIDLTPYSRKEFALACEEQAELDDIERARRFYVRIRQSISGKGTVARESDWSYSVAPVSGPSRTWSKAAAKAGPVIKRFAAIQVENRPALDVIKRFDTPRTLFYCDPPYVHSSRSGSRGYRYEMTDDDHRDLAAGLARIEGRAVVSGYHSPLYDEIYADWRVVEMERRVPTHSSTAKKAKRPDRLEVAWCNFEAESRGLL